MNNVSQVLPQKPQREVQTALFQTIVGSAPGQYLVLANWNYEPVDPDEITGCVVAVDSLSSKLDWEVALSIPRWVMSIARFTPDSYLLGTADGELVKIHDGQKIVWETGIDDGIQCIWGKNDTDCWLTHNQGISHWEAGRITDEFPAERIARIHSIAPEFAVAVGSKGQVVQFDGRSWEAVESSPINTNLIGVFCVSRELVYVSGWNGVLYRWDGKSNWTRISFGGDAGIDQATISSPILYKGNIYVCAGGMGLYRVDDDLAHKVLDSYSSRSAVIAEKLIITGSNSLVEYDGKQSRRVVINLP